VKDGITFLGGLSYPMFLIQNVVGYSIVAHFNPATNVSMIKCILFSVVLCIIAAWCIKTIVSAITNTKQFKKIESLFCL